MNNFMLIIFATIDGVKWLDDVKWLNEAAFNVGVRKFINIQCPIKSHNELNKIVRLSKVGYRNFEKRIFK